MKAEKVKNKKETIDQTDYMYKLQKLGKWELFRIQRDEAIKKYVREKKRVLSLKALVKQLLTKQVIKLIWQRHHKKLLAYIRKL